MTFFVEPEGLDFPQLVFLGGVYGYVLFQAANLIQNGSELLLLIPEVAHLVGGVVLPILGAVPDGMMVLFSGIGPLLKAQKNLAIGVGALAGSTIMLLTVPWYLSILGGRVDLINGVANYKPSGGSRKLTKGHNLFETGIQYKPIIRSTAKMMLVTSLTYLLIQGPALQVDDQSRGDPEMKEVVKEYKAESFFCLVGAIICIIEFCLYLYWQYIGSDDGPKEKNPEEAQSFFGSVVARVRDGDMKPSPSMRASTDNIALRVEQEGIQMYMEKYKSAIGATKTSRKANAALIEGVDDYPQFTEIMAVFFRKYANASVADNKISKYEFDKLLDDLRLNFKSSHREQVFSEVDTDQSGYIDANEFKACFKKLATFPFDDNAERFPSKSGNDVEKQGAADEDDDQEEAEDWPDDIKDLPAAEQRKRVIIRSIWQMSAGTALVLVFSDPMVDVLAELGVQTGIPGFYISFILAPLASNASEVVASYGYSVKKTSASITISLSTLEGAACMNNTFCLSIFLILILVQDLAWKFTAETISILVVQLIMYFFVMAKNVQTLFDAYVVLALFPASLALVWGLENIVGLD